MKNQALFSSKDKSKQIKCHLRQFLFGALSVNIWYEAVQTHPVCSTIEVNGVCHFFNGIQLLGD